jgi:hypothetical protein
MPKPYKTFYHGTAPFLVLINFLIVPDRLLHSISLSLLNLIDLDLTHIYLIGFCYSSTLFAEQAARFIDAML